MAAEIKNRGECLYALQVSWPIFFAYAPIGIVFGVLFTQEHYPWWMAPIESAVIYGGSIQFLVLSMMQDHAGLLAILFASFFVAFRNSFYGLSFLHRYDTHWLIKGFLAFLLVDATYAILLSHETKAEHNNIKFCLWVSVWIWSYWVGGTFIGALFSQWIPPFSALQFILPAFFLSVAVGYWIKLREWHMVIVPIIASVVSYLWLPKQYLIIAIVLSIISILIIDKVKRGHA